MQGKANHGHVPKSVWKHRSVHGKHGNSGKHSNSGQVAIPHHQVRSGIKSPTDPHIAGSQALNIQNAVDANNLKSQTSGFQANFAQSIAKCITTEDSIDGKQISGTTHVQESPAMQLLTQPPVPQETSVALPSPDEMSNVPNIINSNAPTGSPSLKGPQTVSGKACHLIIKKKGDSLGENVPSSPKIHVTNMQIISKPSDMGGIKVLQNRQVVVAPSQNTPQKMINSSGKLMTTKFVQQIPQKSQTQLNANLTPKSSAPNAIMDKVIIVSKSMSSTPPSILQRSLSNAPSKNIIISSHPSHPITHITKDGETNLINKNIDSEGMISKIIPMNSSEMKLPTKTFVLTPKSCQKMVILPAKGSKGSLIGQSVPQLQVKGITGRQTTMKLVPAGNQMLNSQNKTSNLTIVSKANSNILTTKIVSKDSLTHINMSTNDSSPSKLHQTSHVQIAPKPKGQAIIRPTNTKSNLVLVQKCSPLNKGAITFTKNGNELTKLMMTNKISPVATPPTNIVTESEVNSAEDISKNTGNVIVLQLSSDQLEQAGSLEFLEGDQSAHGMNCNLSLKAENSIITQDTPVLLDSQIGEQACNTDSMESVPETLLSVVSIDNVNEPTNSFSDDQSLPKLDMDSAKLSLENTASSIVTDWDMDIEPTSDKEKSLEINKLALELEMSSDSETDGYMDSSQDESKKDKHQLRENQSIQRNTGWC